METGLSESPGAAARRLWLRGMGVYLTRDYAGLSAGTVGTVARQCPECGDLIIVFPGPSLFRLTPGVHPFLPDADRDVTPRPPGCGQPGGGQ